jgi:hypothetical protein
MEIFHGSSPPPSPELAHDGGGELVGVAQSVLGYLDHRARNDLAASRPIRSDQTWRFRPARTISFLSGPRAI